MSVQPPQMLLAGSAPNRVPAETRAPVQTVREASRDAVTHRSPLQWAGIAAAGAGAALLAAKLGVSSLIGRVGAGVAGAGAAFAAGVGARLLLQRGDVVSPKGVTRAAPDEGLRVASFNIRGGRGAWDGPATDQKLQEAADFIRRWDLDAVVIQEIDVGTSRSGGVDQLARLAELSGASDSHFVANFDYQGGQYGQAIITRNGVEIDDGAHGGNDVRRVELSSPSPGDRPHVALAAPLTAPDGQRLTMLGTHLSPGSHAQSRPAQMRDLGAFLAQVRAGKVAGLAPTVVAAGDFNAAPDEIDRQLRPGKLGLIDAFDAIGLARGHRARRTHPTVAANTSGAYGTGREIDHLFTSRDLAVRGVSVLRAPQRSGAEPVTDHYALVADVVETSR